MTTTLLVAAGGGGDAITAAALGPALGLTGERPVVMTYAWDRLIVDPLPGPRSAADFTGLRELAPDVLEILPTTKPIPPAGSTLPRLGAELPARLILLDPTSGAVGMARQIAATANHFHANAVALVDVGGDALTSGKDTGLRSPLADLLALAACSLVDLPTQLLVPAPGVDGELPETTVLKRVNQLEGHRVAVLGGDAIRSTRAVFAWHPSEASGLLAVAAEGVRGRVEVRDAGEQITLTDLTATVFSLSAKRAAASGPAGNLTRTSSLLAAHEQSAMITGISELDYERAKAARLRTELPRASGEVDIALVDTFVHEARRRGADFVTVRRLAELLEIRKFAELNGFREVLAEARPSHYNPPIYRTQP